MIGCVLCEKFKATPIPGGQENLLWILKQYIFSYEVEKFGYGRWPDKKPKLIDEILLFKYLYAYNSAIKRNKRSFNTVL